MGKVEIKAAPREPRSRIFDATLTAVVESEVKADLQKMAEKDGRTLSWHLRQAILEYIK